MADFPPFAFTTQESWYGELSFKAAEDGSALSLAGRQFEMHITPATSGAQLVPPAIILTMETGRGLSLKQGDPSTLVFRVPKTTANTFPRVEFTGDVLEVVDGERYLFMPVRITYAEPSGLRAYLSRFLGVSVSFASRQQPIYTPLAVPGREGRPGATILRGTVPPVPADGKDDDFYIEDRTASGQGRRMWGPKAGGAWPGTPWNIQVAIYTDVPGLPDAIAARALRSANLDDLADKPASRQNLGLGSAAVRALGEFGWRIATFDGASTADIPAPVIAAYVEDRGARYKRVASEPAHPLKFNNGGWWEIDEPRLDVRMAGFVPGANGDAAANAAAVQACINYCYEQLGGEVYLPAGFNNCGPVIMRDRVFLVGPGMTDCYIILPNGANSDFVKSAQYDEFADGVKRAYNWYATTTARNAANRPEGSYAMIAPTQTDFKNAQWFRATATPASSDAAWVPCGAVIGMVGGGVRGFSILGNRENQTGSFWGLALYGVGIQVHDIEVRNASKAIHLDCPGALLAPIGFTAQWSASKIQWREFDKAGLFNNMQSDGTVYDIKGAANDASVADYVLKFGPKATGQKWFGGHIWGGANGTPGIIFEGGGNTLVAVEAERPIIVETTGAGTTYLGGKIYRINALSAEAGAAFTIRAAANTCVIQTRVSHYRYALKLEPTVGIGHKIDLNFYSEDIAAATLDPSGANAVSALSLARNEIYIRPSFSALQAAIDLPRVRTSKLQIRHQNVSGASGALDHDMSVTQLYRYPLLAGNVTINVPTNAVDMDEIEFYFGQDVTGGRTVTFGAGFRGGTAIAASSGGGFTFRTYRFRYNGSAWVFSGGTGAWV